MVAAENENAVGFLLLAYETELNAYARYKEYAAKAEAEGMCGAAGLFRDAARAEQMHASIHARLIRHMGGEATAEIRPFRVKSTLENLDATLGGEEQTDPHQAKSLVRVTANFDGTGYQHDFYVCALCGYTTSTEESGKCPACNSVGDQSKVIH